MRKFFLILFFASAITNLVRAEISFSGYQEFISGSADQTKYKASAEHGIDKSGLSNGIYSRVIMTATSTTDSGIELTGTYTFTRDCRVDTDNCGVSANENALAMSGGFGTFAIGETGTAGTSMHSRKTAGIPTAEPDGLLYTQFLTTDGDNSYTGPNETKYASNPMTAKFFSNSYGGFSFGISYTTNTAENASTGSGQNGQTITYGGDFNDLTEFVAAYSTEFDGLGMDITYGYGTGNGGSQASIKYNDLTEETYSLALSYGGFSADVRMGDRGDSGLVQNNGEGGQEYISYCGMYSMGSISVGYCEEDSDYKTATQTNNQNTRVVSAGYALGGGASFEFAFFSFEQVAGTAVQTDADGVLTKLSFGF